MNIVILLKTLIELEENGHIWPRLADHLAPKTLVTLQKV
jgi:hypothetical protein